MAIRLCTASCQGRAGRNRSGDLLSAGRPSRSDASRLMPVVLPPGCASERTRPSPIMSSVMATIGTLVVAAWAARVASGPAVTMASGLVRTTSRAAAAICWYPASRSRRSMVRFRPSTNPCRRSSSNVAVTLLPTSLEGTGEKSDPISARCRLSSRAPWSDQSQRATGEPNEFPPSHELSLRLAQAYLLRFTTESAGPAAPPVTR